MICLADSHLLEWLSRTQILVSQIRRVIHEVRDMNKYIGNNRNQQSNNLSKQEDLPHMHNPNPHNNEQNGGDYKYSANSKYEPQSQDEHDRPCNPGYHEQNPPFVTNWHFSRSFHFISLNINEHYPSNLILSSSPHSFKPISPAYSVHR